MAKFLLLVSIVIASYRSPSPIGAQDLQTEQVASVTATATPSATPSPTPSPTATLSPTATESLLSPIPSELPTEPTATPTEAASATEVPQTVEPTVTPSHTATATPTVEPAATDSPTVEPSPSPTAEPPISLVIQEALVDFGMVNASGEVDPSISGVTATATEDGAHYVRLEAITLTVTSERPWNGTCRINASISGRIEWRLTGTESWIPFDDGTAQGSYDNACFPDRPLGKATYTYDLRLRVSSSDKVGPFVAAISFAVESEG